MRSGSAFDVPVGPLAWANLSTADLDVSLNFYTDVFGWTYQMLGDSVVAMAGETPAAIVTPTEKRFPSHWHCMFACDELISVAQRLEGCGGQMTFGPMTVEGVGEFVSLVDSAGNPLSLCVCESASGYGLGVGLPAWVELGSSDPAGAREFYSRLMMATPALIAADDDFYRVFTSNGVPVAGLVTTDPSGWRPYFGVDDMRRTLLSAQKAGGIVLDNDESSPFFVGRALLSDPGGASFGIVSMQENNDSNEELRTSVDHPVQLSY